MMMIMMMIDLYTTLSGILVLQTEEKMRCRIFRAPSQKAFFIRKRRNFQKLLARCVSKKKPSAIFVTLHLFLVMTT